MTSNQIAQAIDVLENGNIAERKQAYAQIHQHAKDTGTPAVAADCRVLFQISGDYNKVAIIGDMTEWAGRKELIRIEETNMYYHLDQFPAAARLEYWYELDDNISVDPLNEYQLCNGLGQISELVMPEYQRHNYFSEYSHGEKGESGHLHLHTLHSRNMNYEHDVYVFCPSDIATSTRLESVYFQDGLDYIEFAQSAYVLHRLIDERKIRPTLGVFVCPPNRHQPRTPNRMTEYGLNDAYCSFFVEELVPFIDARYSTKCTAESRLIVGDSYGGLISTYIAFNHPETFANVYSQSGYLSFHQDQLIHDFKSQPVQALNLYIDIGHFEHTVASDIVPASETDFLAANRRFRDVLAEKGYLHQYREYPEGHNWGNWRRHLIDGLIHFFGVEG